MKRPSIVKQVIDFIESRMATGQSRHQAKRLIRKAAPGKWTTSTGRIHSYGTRRTYTSVLLRFARWAKDNHGIRGLEDLLANPGIGVEYLTKRVAAGMSPYTVQKDRAALNLLYWPDRHFDLISIPQRQRNGITRSRLPAKRDKDFQPSRHGELIDFIVATGLRRSELERCLVENVITGSDGRVWVSIRGKGGRWRQVEVLDDDKEFVLSFTKNRGPKEHLFKGIPSRLNTHAFRRAAAQRWYRILTGRPLPPVQGRLTPKDYDEDAVLKVSRMLGHNRKDIVLRHYLR